MQDKIIVKLNPGMLNQTIYIFSNECNTVPLQKEATMEELLSVVTMAAAKYKIEYIGLSGAREFARGIEDQLTEKISTCFGNSNNITIDVL